MQCWVSSWEVKCHCDRKSSLNQSSVSPSASDKTSTRSAPIGLTNIYLQQKMILKLIYIVWKVLI